MSSGADLDLSLDEIADLFGPTDESGSNDPSPGHGSGAASPLDSGGPICACLEAYLTTRTFPFCRLVEIAGQRLLVVGLMRGRSAAFPESDDTIVNGAVDGVLLKDLDEPFVARVGGCLAHLVVRDAAGTTREVFGLRHAPGRRIRLWVSAVRRGVRADVGKAVVTMTAGPAGYGVAKIPVVGGPARVTR